MTAMLYMTDSVDGFPLTLQTLNFIIQYNQTVALPVPAYSSWHVSCDYMLRNKIKSLPALCERDVMMNNGYGWMGGGIWMWAVLAVLVVVVVVVKSLSRK